MLAVEAQPATRAGDRTRTWLVLLMLFAAGLALRAWGMAFGLPFSYHVDEAMFNMVARAAAESGFAELAPNFSAFQLIIAIEHWLFGMIEPLIRLLPLSPEIVAALESPSMRYNVVARMHSVILGAATVFPVYFVGKSLWNRQVGLLAAGFMATCYIHVRDSHFGVPDATVVFFTTVAAYYCSRLYAGASFGRYVLAGLFCGLAVGSKQLVWPIFVVLFLFHAFAPRPDGAPLPTVSGIGPRLARLFHWKIWVAGLVGIGTYLVCVPQTVLRWPEFSAYWQWARTVGANGGMDRLRIDDTGPLGTYIYTLRWGLGDVLFALGIAGLVLGLLRPGSLRVRLFLLFPVIYFAFLLLPGHMYMARYTLSAVPFLLLAAAALVWSVLDRLRLEGTARGAVLAAAVALAIAQPLVASVRHNVILTQTDTRTLAKAWIEENLPEGSTLMLEFWWFSPPLSSDAQPMPFSTRTYRLMSRGAYGLSDFSNSFGPSQGTPSVAEYAAMGVDYIVSNSYSGDSRLLDPEEDRAKRAFYDALDRDAELVKEFSPYVPNQHVPRIFAETYGPAIWLSRYERPGPVLRIYRVRRPAIF